jgi:hypothetical protein
VGEPAGAGVGGGGAAREDGGASMARGAEQAAGKKGALDPASLRGGIPSEQAILAAKPAEKGPLKLACGTVAAGQAEAAMKTAEGAAPGDAERILVAARTMTAGRVYLVRLEAGGPDWYLGPVEGGDSGVYNTVTVGDLRAGRPDVSDLLRLPVGFLTVIGADGVEAIFDPQNQDALQRE